MRIYGIILCCFHIASGGVIRIRRDTDSVVLSETENSVIIDSTAVKVERPDPDQPIERIEIRLESNITKAMVIGIQEVPQSLAISSLPNEEEPSSAILESESLLPAPKDEKLKPDEKKPATLAITVKQAPSNEIPENNEDEEPPMPGGDGPHIRVESKVENYIELPLDDDDDEDDMDSVEEVPVERCFRNQNKLSRDVLKDMKRERRKLKKVLKQYKVQLTHFCTPKKVAANKAYRGCHQWGIDFSVNYFKFYRLLYCSNIDDWPHSIEVQQSMGDKLQLYQNVYAFTADQ